MCFWKMVFAITSVFSWQNSISLCPDSFCTLRPNLPVTPGKYICYIVRIGKRSPKWWWLKVKEREKAMKMEEKKICGLEWKLQVKQHGLFLASPLEEKYCIISNPSRDSGLHLPCFLQHVCQQHLPLSGPTRADDRHTMPARSPPVGGIPSRAIGLPGIIFVILGVSPEGHLGPNPYHPSPKVTNISPRSNLYPLLWNIWSVASYQFVLQPLTNAYNQDHAPVGNIAPPHLLLKYS